MYTKTNNIGWLGVGGRRETYFSSNFFSYFLSLKPWYCSSHAIQFKFKKEEMELRLTEVKGFVQG
jgi:hypothetical protein